MSINVTLGEVKTQEVKPFPKLMIGNTNWIVEVYETDRSSLGYIAIHRAGPYTGKLAIDFKLDGFADYNEPLTVKLQNA